jgi:hypothetical protein
MKQARQCGEFFFCQRGGFDVGLKYQIVFNYLSKVMKKELLPFISNEDFYNHVEKVLFIARGAMADAEDKLHSNVVDPFSALFDACSQGISLSDWIRQEKSRQVQKTLQNAIGDFHQDMLGSMFGWKNLGKGNVVDLLNKDKKIIAEVKNKFNTTKGDHKTMIYDNFKKLSKSGYNNFLCYYVEIIPKGKNVYDKPFIPSDNKKNKRRPEDKNIRVIDGKSFYALASGHKDALKQVYLALPYVIGKIIGNSEIIKENSASFLELFEKAY